MREDEFARQIGEVLTNRGLEWVESAVQRTLEEGIPIVRKDIAPFGMSVDIAQKEDQSRFFSASEDYTAAFERRGARKAVETTRPYTPEESARLYLTALYSALIEPQDLAKAGIELLGADVDTVTFSSESSAQQFSVREVLSDWDEQLETLRRLIAPVMSSAS